MEIEKKFLIKNTPYDFKKYPCYKLEQAYISTSPVIRIRKKVSLSGDFEDKYILTVKSKGFMTREEFEINISSEEYENLLKKADGNIISKMRYNIPLPQGFTLELDVFEGLFEGIVLGEIEFKSEDEAKKYNLPEIALKEVTFDGRFHNSQMSSMSATEISDLILWVKEQE